MQQTFMGRVMRRAAAAALLGAGAAAMAQSGAVITYGGTSLGVNQTGELNFNGLGPGGFMTYGVYRAGVGDAIAPGCPCEGWGVALTGESGTSAVFANQSAGSGGFAGSGNSFGFTGVTATSIASMADLPVTVRHAYGPSLVSDVFQVQVSITNNGLSTLNDLVYRRAMDWDVPPTEFSEYVTHVGVTANLVSNGGNVRYAGNNGFASSDPRSSADWDASWQPTYGNPSTLINTTNTDFNKAGPADHGSVFDFAFGDLDAGQTRVFNIYYGSADNEASALSKLSALKPDVYSLGQSSAGGDPGSHPTFLFAFGGVGGTELGSTQGNPILPFVPAPGVFSFDAPVSGRWYDPPFATGFTIALVGGEMVLITAPTGFDNLSIWVNGVVVDSDFDGGETFNFVAGVSQFEITGFSIDTAGGGFAAAFPLYMEFTPGVTSMTWTAQLAPVPEPGTYAMMVAGLGLLGWMGRRRRAQAAPAA